jgi:hypothetical protein
MQAFIQSLTIQEQNHLSECAECMNDVVMAFIEAPKPVEAPKTVVIEAPKPVIKTVKPVVQPQETEAEAEEREIL